MYNDIKEKIMSDEIYYDQKVYDGGDQEENPNGNKKGFAITALVLGIVSVIGCCCGLGFIAAPISIIFAIIALVKRHGGTAMSIVGIVLSSISLLITILFVAVYGQFFSAYFRFIGDAPAVIEEFKETGELPDYLDEYNDPKYEDFWNEAGYDDFSDFFSTFVDQYESGQNNNLTYDDGNDVVDLG